MVYIMTNSAGNNEVAAFRRMSSGVLVPANRYGTRGSGSGTRGVSPSPGSGVDPLGSQGSLTLSPDGRFLFAVNAGSNSISAFRVSSDGSLSLIGTAPSDGAQPNCLAVSNSLLYAAYTGSSSDNYTSGIAGYSIAPDGRLAMINGSRRNLSMPGAHPASVAFSPDGSYIVVCELTTDLLSVFSVGRGGMLSAPVFNTSNGNGPFGSCFLSSGLLLTAQAGTNALASYTLSAGGRLSAVSSAPNGQTATCWVAPSMDERSAYTSNAGTGTISTFSIDSGGTVSLVENLASTGTGPMGAPIDSGVSRDGRNFYVLNGNQGSVSAFSIAPGGRLSLIQVLTNTGLPVLGSQGMAVL